MFLAAWLLNGCSPTLVALNTKTDTTDEGYPDDTGIDTVTDTTTGDDDDDVTSPGDDDDDDDDDTGGLAAPTLDPLDGFLNDPEVVIQGDAEPQALITLTATCDMGSSGTDTMTATSVGGLIFQWELLPGETCEFYATAELGGLVSDPSNVVSTSLCATIDPREGTGIGDDPQNPADEWGPLPDNNSNTVVISGTLPPSDPGDWFVVHGTDDPIADAIAGSNQYDMRIRLTAGDGIYSFRVTKGEPGYGDPQCFVEGTANPSSYTDFNDYFFSTAWGNGTACALNATYGYDNCDDLSADYYIEVVRDTNAPAGCEPYEITITNNGL